MNLYQVRLFETAEELEHLVGWDVGPEIFPHEIGDLS